MGKTNTFETSLLEHIFKNLAIANIGDATGVRGSSTAGNLYISLHTSDPGEAGDQTTNEATYGSYARVAVARSGTYWDVTSGVASNVSAISFAACSSGTNTITHVGIGTASSGAGSLLWSGALGASLAVSTGVTPQFAAGQLTVSED